MSQAKPTSSVSGAVVVPAGTHVDRSILATEDGASVGTTSLPAIKPSEVDVNVDVGPWPRVWLSYRIPEFVALGIACVVFISIYCYVLRKPYAVLTVDSNAPTSESITSWKLGATFIRTVLPPAFAAGVGYVLTVVCVPDHLLDAESSQGRRAVSWMLKKAIAVFFCLPLTGIALEQQSKRVTPQIAFVDLAKHTSLLQNATAQADSVREDPWRYGTNTTSTILRRSMLPPINQLRDCDIYENQSSNAYTSVAYEFIANEWQAKVLPAAVDPLETWYLRGPTQTKAPVNSTKTTFNASEAALFESLFARAVYLYADAVLVQDPELGGKNTAALSQLKLDAIAHHDTNAITNVTSTANATLHMQSFVRGYFAQATAWSSLLRANVSDIGVAYTSFKLTSNIDFVAVTLDIPLESTIWHRRLSAVNGSLVEQNITWPGTGDVVYEIDVAKECGPKTCGIQNRGAAPDPKVVAYGVCPEGFDCSQWTAINSMWLAGFGRRIEGESFQLLNASGNQTNPWLRKAILRNPREYHRVTMGFLSYPIEDLDQTFAATCTVSSGNCQGVSVELDTSAVDDDVRQFLVVGRSFLPMQEFGSSFDLSNNLARGRPLVTRYTTGARVEFEILRPANFDSYVWTELSYGSCSGKMERSIITTELNHIYVDNPLQVTYTAGMFFLFHNARLVAALTTKASGSLDFLGNFWEMDYAFAVPAFPLLAGLIDGGLAVAFSIFLVWKRHKNISEWSTGCFQDPNIFVRGLADSAFFPGWFFRIGYAKSLQSEPINLRGVAIKSIEFEPLTASGSAMVIQRPKNSDKEASERARGSK